MSQADPTASAATASPEEVERRSWWTTLPGLLTAAAGLISAVTGLIVAIQQLAPSHAPAGSSPVTQAQVTTSGAATSAARTQAMPQTPTGAALPLRVAFRAGRHVKIGQLRYDVLSAAARPANPGQLTLALHVRMTNNGVYDANFWNQTFRLQTAAGTSAPTNFLDDLVHGGTTHAAEVDFNLPATTRTARLLVGDDPAHAIALPIVLSRARS